MFSLITLTVSLNHKISKKIGSKILVELVDVLFKFEMFRILFISFLPRVGFHKEASHLICSADQVAAFYMKCNAGMNWVKRMLIVLIMPSHELWMPSNPQPERKSWKFAPQKLGVGVMLERTSTKLPSWYLPAQRW